MLLTQTSVCPVCGAALVPSGDCVGCLLRVGLDEADGAEETPLGLPRFFGDFEIDRREDGSRWELGRGAAGVTYRATDQVLHRAVALKVVAIPADPAKARAVRERFLREARGAASLRHPNVAEVFQFGTSPETAHAYYAMEFIDGETLEERVRRDGPLPVNTVLDLAVQVARALVAAADKGLVHRDLKPGNIMLSRDPLSATARATVIDFGLAKAMAEAAGGANLTHGGFVGTPAFASPEQFRGETADARSDIYSLGVTLWFMLTGSPPFAGTTLDEWRDHPARTALPLRQLAARKVPALLIALLRAALAVDPAARPASAREFLSALERCRPRRTGRFLAAGTALALAAAGLVWWTHGRRGSVPPPAAPDKSVAVLPFDNFSEDKDSAFFADGVQDEVLADLSKVADLKVISRSSVMQYRDAKRRDVREIGRMLEVAHVLEGSVQRAGNRVRVTVQLIDARTDAHLWAEHYDRDLTDVFAIQSEIALAVASQLQAVISPQEQAAMDEVPTRNEEAYRFYLRALARLNDWNLFDSDDHPMLAETLALLREATTRDPGFVRAHVLTTRLRGSVYGNDPTPANAAAVRESAETVARLRPGSADAALAMGFYDYMVQHDLPRARDELTAAARQSPNDPWVHNALGAMADRSSRWDEALAHFRRASELDPENNVAFYNAVEVLAGLRRYPEAMALTERRLAAHPTQLWLHVRKGRLLLDWKADTHGSRAEMAFLPPTQDPGGNATFRRVQIDEMDRDFDAAARDLAACPLDRIAGTPRAVYEGDIARHHGDAPAAATAYAAARPLIEEVAHRQPEESDPVGNLAMLDALLGRREKALEEGRRMLSLAIPGDAQATVVWAQVQAFAGERDEAIRILQTICGKPYGPTYGSLRLDPDWDALRGDPRFETMVTSLAPK